MIKVTHFPELANTSTPLALVTNHAGRAKTNMMDFHQVAVGIVAIWGNYPHVLLFSHREDIMAYALRYG